MIIDAILAGLIFYLTFPLLTGYNAAQYGRSFKRWFVFGLFFPIISYLVLCIVIFWDERKTKQARLTRREQMLSDSLVKNLVKESSDPDMDTHGIVLPAKRLVN